MLIFPPALEGLFLIMLGVREGESGPKAIDRDTSHHPVRNLTGKSHIWVKFAKTLSSSLLTVQSRSSLIQRAPPVVVSQAAK